MHSIAALGCGILAGFVFAGMVAPLGWRLLATCPLPRGRAARLLFRAQSRLRARVGHHPYAIACLEALADAPDAAAHRAAQARLKWWCAVRLSARP